MEKPRGCNAARADCQVAANLPATDALTMIARMRGRGSTGRSDGAAGAFVAANAPSSTRRHAALLRGVGHEPGGVARARGRGARRAVGGGACGRACRFWWSCVGPSPRVRAVAAGLRRTALGVLLYAASVLVGVPHAEAAPLRGTGGATFSEVTGKRKKPATASEVRGRALSRARSAALKKAVAELTTETKADPAARKAVFKATSAWTGSYRIVSDRRQGDAIEIVVEVDVDLDRLAKRLLGAPSSGGGVRPRLAVGQVHVGADCGDAASVTQRIRDELEAVGAVVPQDQDAAAGGTASSEPGVATDLHVTCEPLGVVRYTHLHAARVEVSASTQTRALSVATRESFADTPQGAVDAGLVTALVDVAQSLRDHRRGRIVLRVEGSRAGDRVRRLEQAIERRVSGVGKVSVSGLEPGAVLLSVTTELTPEVLGSRLSKLSLPGFSVTIAGTEAPDVVTIRLR